MRKYKIFISTARNLTPYLNQELLSLGFKELSVLNTGLFLEATFSDIMRLNLCLHSANHIFLLIKEFKCSGPEELYKQVYDIEWENIIFEDGYISIFSNVSNLTIRDNRFANLKCKDAIVDRLVRIKGKRPDSGPLRDKTVVYLYWIDNHCAIYIDTSGESLSKRGYRKIPLKAPLQETLASGIILATNWQGKTHFVNPMCGSGTLAIEAAFIALNRAPSIFRKNFGFMHTKLFKISVLEGIRKELLNKENRNFNSKIIATDIDKDAIEASYKNACLAQVENYIEFKACDYKETPIPQPPGIIIINPEYGIRLGRINELENSYGEIGDFLKQKCSGFTAYIFSGNIDLLKKVRLKTQKKLIFFNADIECRLYEYSLYEGSKRAPKSTTEHNQE
ncbi:MAG: class I SAM-dependent RNA methyltransferase [Candidatus Omnitrophica bacterium]|jgi:putative N6-adenine-specific DNA methylase|nr:class I SAM-dependent RNA methyltransferase [Candidatus Omnitrophota bacterium]